MSFVKVEKMDGGYTLELHEETGLLPSKRAIARNHDLSKKLLEMLGSNYSKKKINPSETIPKVKKSGLTKTKMGK